MGNQTILEIPIEIQEQLRRGNLLLFLGEGINHGPGGVSGMPTYTELAAKLASRCNCPHDAPPGLPEVAQFYEDTGLGRQPILSMLKDLLDRPDFAPGKNHQLLARLPVKVIVTTCYDDLMERAFRMVSPTHPYTLVIGRVDTSFLDEEKTTIVKLWGDLSQPESLVVTSDDRRTLFQSRQSMEHFLSSELERRSCIFLGLDPMDPWFRDFFDNARRNVRGFDRQAFVVGPKVPDHVLSWWRKRSVVVLEAEIAEFLNALAITTAAAQPITPVNPYKLLEPFSGVDRSVFAGRDRETQELLQRLERQSLIVLFGESGTGKTSLINAGLIPCLRDAGWLVVSVRCLDEPVHLIRRETLGVVQQASGLTIDQLKGEVEALGATADLAEFMRRLGHYLTSERRRLVIVVDQFEEIFARAGELQRQQLAHAIRAIQELPELRGWLVALFALREDYLGQLWSWAHDYDLGAAWYNAFRITRLTDTQSRQAIVEPSQQSDAVFEPALVDQVLGDLRNIGDGLVYPPYLQVVCFALFEHGLKHRSATTVDIGVDDYEVLGGAERIITDYLDKSLFEGLTPVYQRIAEGVLDALTGAAGLRTLMSLDEISRVVGDDLGYVHEVLEVLVSRRVVRPYWDKDQLKGYELVHDFLSQRFFDRLDPARQQQKLALQLYRHAVSEWETLKWPVDHSRLDMFFDHADVLPFDEAGYYMVLRAAASDADRFAKWAKVIAHRVDERSVDALIERLDDPQWLVRIAAIRALGNMGEKASRAVEALGRRLSEDRTWQVREAAARVLGDLGEVAFPGMDRLIRSLADQTRHVRHAAAEAVGKIRVTPQMVEPLVAQLSNPDKEVREAVVDALVSIGQAAVNPLIQQLASSNMTVCLAAIQALVGIGPEASSAAAALVTTLGDEETIRRAAIHALTRIGRGAVGPLVAALGSEDEQVRLSVLEVLGSIGREIKPEMGPILFVRALEDESSRIRLAATRALGQVRGIPALVQLGDEQEWVRRDAARVLRGETFDQAVEPILAALRDDDNVVCREIARLLGQVKDVRAVEPLIAVLKVSNPGVRCTAAEALGQLGDERAVEPLIAALGDSDSGVRVAAAQALGQLGDERAVEPLIVALEDCDASVGVAAAQALGQLGDKRAVEPLIVALEDSDASVLESWTVFSVLLREVGPKRIEVIKAVRQVAALGLKESKELVDSAPSTVLEAVSWKEAGHAKSKLEAAGAVVEVVEVRGEGAVTVTLSGIRNAAAQALGQLGDERAVEPLLVALGDTDLSVRVAAAQALGQLGDKRAVEPLIVALENRTVSTVFSVLLREVGPKEIEVIKAVRQVAALGLKESKELVDSAPSTVLEAVSWKEAGHAKSRLEAAGAVVEVRGKDPVAVIRALGQLGDGRVVEPLLVALGDTDSSVRVAAAQALGQLGGKRAVEPLIVALENRTVSTVFSVLLREVGPKKIEVIKAVRQVAALGLKESKELVDSAPSTVLEAVSREEAEYAKSRLEAAGAVVEVRGKDPVAVIRALGQLGDERAVDPLIAALGESDSGVRMAAAQALGQLGGKRAVETLLVALRDSDSDVRMAAVQALGQLGDERAVGPLIAILRDSDLGVCVAAAQVLGQLGDKRAVEPLIVALENPTVFSVLLREVGPKKIEVIKAVRQVAALGLKESKELVDSAPSMVLEAVSWKEAEYAKSKLEAAGAVVEVRGKDPMAVIRALGQLGDERAVDPLFVALRDSDSGVRVAAAQALGQLGDKRAVEPLSAILRDSDSGVRVAAAQALGQLGDKRAVELLIVALEDRTAFSVLLQEVGPEKIEVIKAVRRVAALGLKESKELVDSAPSTVLEAVSREEAEYAKSRLEAAGAVVEVVEVRGKDAVSVIRAPG